MKSKIAAAFRIVDALHCAGIPAIIAGGCGRDVYHNIEPKDFDIIVPECASASAVQEALASSRGVSVGRFFPMYDKADGDRINWVQKATVDVDPEDIFSDHVDIDVIRYGIPFAFGAWKWFDFNLNQFRIMRTWGDGYVNYHAVFVGDRHPSKGLVKIRDDMSAKREEYIKAKWETLYGKNGQ